MKSKLLNDDEQKTFAVILDSGDEVMGSLLLFAKQQQLSASRFTAIGAISKATLGFFDFTIRDYKKIEVDEQAEVLSLVGDISMYKDEQKLHAHIVLGKADGTAHGGHLMEATVHPTLEIIITESPIYLEREIDKDSGLALIKI
jgi:predicted DNA-binding protein with PD1-like motif